MLSFSSMRTGQDTEAGMTYFRVQSSKCWYSVNVGPATAKVMGPGVDETYDLDGCDLPEGLSQEGIALMVVIMFEEQE